MEMKVMRSFDHSSGKYINIDSAKIYYEIIGDESDPVLLFLHGGLGNIEDFNDVISALPDKFRIIGIESRGHGKSTLGSQELSYELLQHDVEVILNYLNINELTIIGFSNGGTIAYRLAALGNLKINKLITIGAPWCTKHSEHLREAYSKLTSESWKEFCPSDFQSYIRLNPQPEFEALFRQAMKMALDTSTTGRPNEYVQNISCSSLIVRGENDPVVSNSDIFELSKLIKNSHLLDIPSAGHEAFQDQHELFADHLKKFLAL
jgi:pimeloyl-ACP methyl ester carboxylesterase